MPAPKAHDGAQQGEGRCGTLQEGKPETQAPLNEWPPPLGSPEFQPRQIHRLSKKVHTFHNTDMEGPL